MRTRPPATVAGFCMSSLVPEGGAVADPFAGSGSLGDAALATGRFAWLSDADPH